MFRVLVIASKSKLNLNRYEYCAEPSWAEYICTHRYIVTLWFCVYRKENSFKNFICQTVPCRPACISNAQIRRRASAVPN